MVGVLGCFYQSVNVDLHPTHPYTPGPGPRGIGWGGVQVHIFWGIGGVGILGYWGGGDIGVWGGLLISPLG